MCGRKEKAYERPDHCLCYCRVCPGRDGKAETVTPKFEGAIPNIPGKSLVALEGEYATGAASVPHTHASPLSSTPT